MHHHAGRGLLLLTPRTRDLAESAVDRTDVLMVTNLEPLLLLRPDGVVAWTPGNPESLDSALDTWFGHVPARR